jgi:hypothetical protein
LLLAEKIALHQHQLNLFNGHLYTCTVYLSSPKVKTVKNRFFGEVLSCSVGPDASSFLFEKLRPMNSVQELVLSTINIQIRIQDGIVQQTKSTIFDRY